MGTWQNCSRALECPLINQLATKTQNTSYVTALWVQAQLPNQTNSGRSYTKQPSSSPYAENSWPPNPTHPPSVGTPFDPPCVHAHQNVHEPNLMKSKIIRKTQMTARTFGLRLQREDETTREVLTLVGSSRSRSRVLNIYRMNQRPRTRSRQRDRHIERIEEERVESDTAGG